MTTVEHPREWQELVKNMSMGRKSQPEALSQISQSEEERKLWMEEDKGSKEENLLAQDQPRGE